MKESFDELFRVAKQDRMNSPWSKEKTLKGRMEELKKEVEEVLEAVEKEDAVNLHEELGDTLWDLLTAIVLAEEKYGIDPKEIIDNIVAKIKRRKPWIFDEHSYTVEEEYQMWQEAKEKEKNGEN